MKYLRLGNRWRLCTAVLASGFFLACTQHSMTLASLDQTATEHIKAGNLADAQRIQEEVVEVLRRNLGSEHPRTLTAIARLIELRTSLGDVDGGRTLFDEVLAGKPTVQAQSGPDQTMDIVGLLGGLGEFSAARAYLEEVTGPEDDVHLGALARVLLAQRATLEGIAVLERIWKTRELRFGMLNADTLAAKKNFAQAVRYAGKTAKARSYQGQFERDRSAYRKVGGYEKPYEGQEFLLDLLQSVNTGLFAAVHHSHDLEQAFRHVEDYRATSIQVTREEGTGLLPRLKLSQFFSLEVNDPNLQAIDNQLNAVTRALDRLDGEHKGQDLLLVERARLQVRRYGHLSRRIESIEFSSPEFYQPPPPPKPAQASLDPGTVLLSYLVEPDHTELFIVAPQRPIEWHRLPVASEFLQQQVEKFSESIGFDMRTASSLTEGEASALARWFFDLLVAPASDAIASAQRVLVIPDGPLNRLPFSALLRPIRDGHEQYMVEWKPIHVVQSLAAYSRIRSRRREEVTGTLSLVALGDPVYGRGEALASSALRRPLPWTVRSAAGRNPLLGLPPLPYTAHEIAAIESMFLQAAAPRLILLGEDATEEAVKQNLAKGRYIHLAVHGFADPVQLDHSYLAFSLPQYLSEHRENGILEAWEIIDQVRMDAELVTLSACTTALGPDRGGEGLMSLTHAFQIAGARSVLSSIWEVNDAATSELMIRFYRYMLAGMSKDLALRAAQSDLIRGPIQIQDPKSGIRMHDFTAPYYWAAFQLFGDWQ